MNTKNNATEANLVIINQVEAGLSALEESCKELPDFNTPEGYARAKELRKPITKARTTGDKARLAATAGLRDQVKSINSMWSDDILPRIEAIEGPLTAGIKEVDDRVARLEQEKAEAEQARIEGIEQRLSIIKALPSTAITLEQVTEAIESIRGIHSGDTFAEFREQARSIIQSADEALHERKKALEAQAAETKRLAEQAAEQQRIAAEQQAKQAEIDAQLKAIEDSKAEQVRKDEQVAREKELAAKAEQDKAQALEAAETKRLADIETAKQEAAQAEKAKADKLEAERLAGIKREEEAKAEQERIAAAAPDIEKLTAWVASIPDLPNINSSAGAASKTYEQLVGLLGQMDSLIVALNSEKSKAA